MFRIDECQSEQTYGRTAAKRLHTASVTVRIHKLMHLLYAVVGVGKKRERLLDLGQVGRHFFVASDQVRQRGRRLH